jgi:hypothetical protein
MEDEIPADDGLSLGRLVGNSRFQRYVSGCFVFTGRQQMKLQLIVSLFCVLLGTSPVTTAQEDQPSQKPPESALRGGAEKNPYSGMYSFLQEGEFVQLTVEDEGRVTGFISRFGDGESDKGVFLDQFFKEGKLDGNKLSFSTQLVHGSSFDFKGAVQRGEGKNPGDDAYFVLNGTLTENLTDENKKVTSKARTVAFKMFPQEAAPSSDSRK